MSRKIFCLGRFEDYGSSRQIDRPLPTSHTFLLSVTCSLIRFRFANGPSTGEIRVPSQWSRTPAAPAIHTSLSPTTATLFRSTLTLVVSFVHAVPSNRIANPAVPTTQTWLLVLGGPLTAVNFVVPAMGTVMSDGVPLLIRTTVPLPPTAQTSLPDRAQMLWMEPE